jgi:hypothetical protein
VPTVRVQKTDRVSPNKLKTSIRVTSVLSLQFHSNYELKLRQLPTSKGEENQRRQTLLQRCRPFSYVAGGPSPKLYLSGLF